MTQILPLFTENILPIFLIAGAGFFLGHFTQIDPRSISRVIFYLFSPCLVFILIANNHLPNQDIASMITLAVTVMASNAALAFIAGKILKLERGLIAAVVLASMFSNAGNFGLSLNTFAFGEQALTYASIYFITSSIMVYTAGVLIASMGKTNLKQAAFGLLKLPVLYALVLAVVFRENSWAIPLPLNRSIDLLAQAAIPSMLILLGLQLRNAVNFKHWPALTVVGAVKLIASPLVALAIGSSMNLSGPAWQAAISEAAMPSAVITIVLATEFEANPAFVTSAVTLTTLLSPLTLTPLLGLLGG